MTLSPINEAAAAFLAAQANGEEEPQDVVLGTPEDEFARLLNVQAKQGSISAEEYRTAQARLGLGKRQIQRRLAACLFTGYSLMSSLAA